MATPMILELLNNLKARVATNETNIATNAADIATNRADFDTHAADDIRHWTTTDRQNFDRVVHFKGYFTTKAKLEEAYPTGELGDYAIVGATDTVWAWDDTTNKWLNTTEQGIVISVNGRTGEVILTKTDVGLGNVDNTSDTDKPISTAQQIAFDAKADRKTITESEVDSVSLRAGIYYLNVERTILEYIDDKWTVIVGENDGKTVDQLWITAQGDDTENCHIFVRRLINDGTSERWSDFQEIVTNIEFAALKADVDLKAYSSDVYTKTEIDNQQEAQDDLIQQNADDINSLAMEFDYTEGEGASVTVESILENCLMNIRFGGNCVQSTTTGKNLYNSDTVIVVNGLGLADEGYFERGDVACYLIEIPQDNSDVTLSYNKQESGSRYFGFTNEIPSNTSSTHGGRTLFCDDGVLGNVSGTITNNGYKYLIFSGSKNEVFTDMQVELNDEQTSYEPYTGGEASPNPDYPQDIKVATGINTITINSVNHTLNLGNIELCKIGDYQDYIYKENGVWYLHKAIEKATIDKDITYTIGGFDGYYRFQTALNVAPIRDDSHIIILSNYFKGTSWDNRNSDIDNYIFIAGNEFGINTSDFTTIAEFKTWLTSHTDAIIYYVLATPTDTEITDNTLIAQLDGIISEKAVLGQNTISSTCQPENAPILFKISVPNTTVAELQLEVNMKSNKGGGGSGGGAVTSVNNKTGDVILTKNDIGLTNVDNTADADKNVNSAQSATNDDLGNKISDTYVKKSGDTMTGDLTLQQGKINLTANASLSYNTTRKTISFLVEDVVVATLNADGVFNANKFTENVGGIGSSGGSSGSGSLPIGTVVIYPSQTVPDGWMLCDGRAISRADYEDLFNILGTTYGAGDGSVTFNLPDFKQRTPVGYDANSDIASILGLKDGEKEHTLTISEIPSNTVNGVNGVYIEDTTTNYTQLTGTADAHNNMQPYIVQNFIIKVLDTGSGSGGSDIEVLNEQSESTINPYSAHYVNELIKNNGGNEVYVGDEQDAPASTKLLVDTEDDSWNNIGTEVVDTLSRNEANRAPSVRAVNEALENTEIYSTDEVRIGTWIDGKPLYRKVISSTLPKVTTEDVEARKSVSIDADIGTGFIETAYCNNYNQMLPIPFIFSGGQVIKAYIGLDGSITLSSNTAYTNEQQVIVIVCYTKTTD